MEYNTYEKRLQSFINTDWILHFDVLDWKISCVDLAKAGFYSIGYQDFVKCFECNGGIREWEPYDDPWIEHAKYYPTCKYIKNNRSKTFIECCVELCKIRNDTNKIISDFDCL